MQQMSRNTANLREEWQERGEVIQALEKERDARREQLERSAVRNGLAEWILRGVDLQQSGANVETEDESSQWVNDVHAYREQAAEWLFKNLSQAEASRFINLSSFSPPLPKRLTPVNKAHHTHFHHILRYVENLEAILKDYPPADVEGGDAMSCCDDCCGGGPCC